MAADDEGRGVIDFLLLLISMIDDDKIQGFKIDWTKGSQKVKAALLVVPECPAEHITLDIVKSPQEAEDAESETEPQTQWQSQSERPPSED